MVQVQVQVQVLAMAVVKVPTSSRPGSTMRQPRVVSLVQPARLPPRMTLTAMAMATVSIRSVPLMRAQPARRLLQLHQPPRSPMCQNTQSLRSSFGTG